MTATTTALVPVQPAFSDAERLALAGFLAGYRGLTREAYALDLRQFTTWCRARTLNLFAVRRADIEGFARELEARGRARATVTRRLCTIAGFYRYAVEEELLEHSPAAHVRRPRVDYESHAVALDRNELGALLVSAGLGPPAEHALISLLALNGLRVSEATGADIEQLGLERGHRTLTITRKGGKVVTIPLAPRTARAIDLVIGERTSGPVFLAADGRRLDRHGAGRIVRKVASRAGTAEAVTPHTLRHAFITAAQRRGVASDATFRAGRGDAVAGAAALPAVGPAGWPATGHAVDQWFLAAGCGGCQDVASESVAVDDRWLHLASRGGGGGMGAVRGPLALVAAGGAVPVSPGAALLAEMLAGWRRQQQARRLTIRLIDERERVVRQFAAHTGCWPWQWSAAQAEAWVASGGWAHSAVGSYQGALALFLEYVCDPRYGWVSECERRAGAVPVQVFHERNTAAHVSEHEGRPERRPLTRAELQAVFDAADGHVDRAAGWRRKGGLAAFRDATLFTVVYGWGLRRREAAMLDVADFAPNPAAPELGALGVCHVRYGKAMRGSPPRRRAVAPWAVAALAQYIDEVRPRYGAHAHPALWLTERGERVSPRSVDERFAAWRKAAGLPRELSVRCLRHWYISQLIEDGAGPLFVQFLSSPRKGVHDVHHGPGRCGNLRAGGGYLRSSVTQIPRRFDACAAGGDARLVA